MKTVAVTIGIDMGPYEDDTPMWYRTAYRRLAAWSCGHVEQNLQIETRIVGKEYLHLGVGRFPASTVKLALFDIFPDIDRLIFFDADWRPVRKFNLFDYCPDPEKLYFTKERQPAKMIHDLEDKYGLERNRYFNGGFFVATRKHHAHLFRRAKENYHKYSEKWVDQCVMNQDFNSEVTLADKRLNSQDIPKCFNEGAPIIKNRDVLAYHHQKNHHIMEGWMPDFDWNADE